MTKRKKKKKKNTSRRPWWLYLAVAVAAICTLGGLFVWITWPDVEALTRSNPKTTAFIEAAKARGDQISWRWVPYDEISLELKKAVVAAEDMSFFSHDGFDTHEIKAAARDAVAGKRVRGASTITQQLAKNLWLTPSRSPLRKLREVALTRQLENHLSKQRILEIYLNVVQFGPEIYGAGAAAEQFFDLRAIDLDAEMAAQLAASLPRPSSWHPGVTTRGYRKATSRVRARAEQVDWLDQLL